MGNAVTRQIIILRLQVQRQTEAGGVLHGAQQHLGIDQRPLRLRKGNTAGLMQGGQFGQFFSGQRLGECAEREDMRQAGDLAAPDEAFDRPGFIQHRLCVRRAGEGGDAAGGSGGEFGFDIAQAGGKIDQSRCDDTALRIDRAGRGKAAAGRLAKSGDAAVGDVDVGVFVDAVVRVDEAAIDDADQSVFHACVPA